VCDILSPSDDTVLVFEMKLVTIVFLLFLCSLNQSYSYDIKKQKICFSS